MKLGNGKYEDDICYKEQGHSGKCYKSPGHEAEDLIQALLEECGCFVAKGTIYEDHRLKIDFWVFGEEAKKVNGGEYVPIQFTVDRQAACGTKGLQAIRGGVIIVCIGFQDLIQWENSQDPSLKDVIRWRIYHDFWESAFKVVKAFHWIHWAKPMCKLDRFKEIRQIV